MKSVLCYGDSLTAGFYRYGSEFYPYGDTLAKLGEAKVDVVGMSGWTSEEMVQCTESLNNEDAVGFTSDGLIKLLKSNNYDIICLMAGTNDLGMGICADDIIENLHTLTKICLETNEAHAKVVLLTIPPSRGEPFTGARRATVNTALASFADNHPGKVFLVDTGSTLPITDTELWDSDMLHLSPVGSERLGKLVYDQLCSQGLLAIDEGLL